MVNHPGATAKALSAKIRDLTGYKNTQILQSITGLPGDIWEMMKNALHLHKPTGQKMFKYFGTNLSRQEKVFSFLILFHFPFRLCYCQLYCLEVPQKKQFFLIYTCLSTV